MDDMYLNNRLYKIKIKNKKGLSAPLFLSLIHI